jgi:type IV pilus assembly protein PilQ
MIEHLLKMRFIAVLFFCTLGWICADQAIGAGEPDVDSGGVFASDDQAPSSFTDQAVKVGSFGQVDLHVKELEVSQVLQLLSLQSQRNIIASRNVAGSISADLYSVDFYEALDAILHTNGFGYLEKGNLIFVYTTSELQEIEEAQRKRTYRVIRLNYITAADASTFVTPLLSEAGQISISGDVSNGFQPSISDGGANSFAHSDTMIVHDYAENVDEIVAVIEDLDQRPKQVLVEATILQARLSENNAFGVDLSVLADFAIDQFTDPLGIVDDILGDTTAIQQGRGAASTTVGNTNTGDSGIKIGLVTHSVSAFIKALESVTDTTVLANPKVLVLNRQKADLLVGEKLGYLSSTATDTSTTQTVEFLEIGTQLTLRPFVSDDGFIRMELKPSISDGNTNRTVGSFVVPETTNQEMTTNVIVRNGQTVVLGGLFKEDTEVTRRQVPLLGDIPILGAMFKGQDDTVSRNEVIFMITPTIVRDETLYAMGERAEESVELARLGARQGLLPWSRTKMMATHIRDAQKSYDSGDREKALWSVNMALTLDPKATEALRIKEVLTGERVYSRVNFSILESAVEGLIDGEINGPSGRTTTPDDYYWPQDGQPPLPPMNPGPDSNSMRFPEPAEFDTYGQDRGPVSAYESPSNSGRQAPQSYSPRDTGPAASVEPTAPMATDVQWEEAVEDLPQSQSGVQSWLESFVQTPDPSAAAEQAGGAGDLGFEDNAHLTSGFEDLQPIEGLEQEVNEPEFAEDDRFVDGFTVDPKPARGLEQEVTDPEFTEDDRFVDGFTVDPKPIEASEQEVPEPQFADDDRFMDSFDAEPQSVQALERDVPEPQFADDSEFMDRVVDSKPRRSRAIQQPKQEGSFAEEWTPQQADNPDMDFDIDDYEFEEFDPDVDGFEGDAVVITAGDEAPQFEEPNFSTIEPVRTRAADSPSFATPRDQSATQNEGWSTQEEFKFDREVPQNRIRQTVGDHQGYPQQDIAPEFEDVPSADTFDAVVEWLLPDPQTQPVGN